MSIYIYPAIVALLFKLGVLAFAYKAKHSKTFTTLLIVFACHNLCEVLVYLQYFDQTSTEWIVRTYYVITYWAMAYLVIYALEVSKLVDNRKVTTGLLILSAIATVLLVGTDLVISGRAYMSYTLTAVHGPHYWFFQSSVLALLLGVVTLLIVGYRRAKDTITEVQCSYMTLALSPMALGGVLIVVLQALNFEINSTMVLPVTSTLFLLMVVLGESRHRLTDIRAFIPFSAERTMIGTILRAARAYSLKRKPLKEVCSDIETALVVYSLTKNEFNVSRTAQSINIKRSSLYSICKRLEINPRDAKVADSQR